MATPTSVLSGESRTEEPGRPSPRDHKEARPSKAEVTQRGGTLPLLLDLVLG